MPWDLWFCGFDRFWVVFGFIYLVVLGVAGCLLIVLVSLRLLFGVGACFEA